MSYRWPDLLTKYLKGEITETELKEFYRQAALSKAKQAQWEDFATKKGIISQLKELEGIDPAQHYESFKKRLEAIRQQRQAHVARTRVMVAAMFILAFSTIVFYKFAPQLSSVPAGKPPLSMHRLEPGKEPVFLLHNGSVIKLDSVPDGEFIAPGMPFRKKGSTLVYAQTEREDQAQTQGTNILSVPPGRRYQITLADGSVIVLNAASQLHFPVHFSSNERWVAMEGEAWFEVNANPAKPFFVNVNNQFVTKVTGTSFNIKAYQKDDINTTLIKGHLTVTHINNSVSRSLQAGQQASFKNGILATHATPKMDPVIAWKNNKFIFENSSIDEMMQEIGRWYGVKIKYKGRMPCTKFQVKLSRMKPLSEIINLISMLNEINIVVSNDTLIISPQ